MKKIYDNWGFKNQVEMFKFIYENRNHVSFLSGKALPGVHSRFFLNIFCHVLSKAQNKYPKYCLNPQNIILLTAEEHSLLDFGTTDQRMKYAKENGCNWAVIYKLQDKLKLEYFKFSALNP